MQAPQRTHHWRLCLYLINQCAFTLPESTNAHIFIFVRMCKCTDNNFFSSDSAEQHAATPHITFICTMLLDSQRNIFMLGVCQQTLLRLLILFTMAFWRLNQLNLRFHPLFCTESCLFRLTGPRKLNLLIIYLPLDQLTREQFMDQGLVLLCTLLWRVI